METKTLQLTEFKVEGDEGRGTFEGIASTFGGIDSHGDTIDAGAYKETLPEFVDRGFLSWNHDWKSPIGFFTGAEETPKGLVVRGEFHSDSQSQMYRQRVRERIGAGKFMGLSIGYTAQDSEFRSIEGKRIRALTRIKLHEAAMVMTPSDALAHVTAVKSELELPEELRIARERFEALLLEAADVPEMAAQLAAIDQAQLKSRLFPTPEAHAVLVTNPETEALIERFQRLNAAYIGVAR